MEKKSYIIAGPTASGKTKLAVRLAKKVNGVVINADAIQLYQDVPVLTARPTEEEQQGIPHYLYGFADCYTVFSVEKWLTQVQQVFATQTQPVVFVGGSGMYINALINGIQPVPDIPAEIRTAVREMEISELQAIVGAYPFSDKQRLQRAAEVQLTTGKSLLYFQSQPAKKYINSDFSTYYVCPKRDIIYEQCNNRFQKMLNAGALKQVKDLLWKKPTGGVLKTIGVAELSAFLTGKKTLEEAVATACLNTRHYAKRQFTWFNKYLSTATKITDSIVF